MSCSATFFLQSRLHRSAQFIATSMMWGLEWGSRRRILTWPYITAYMTLIYRNCRVCLNVGVEPKIGVYTPKIINFNRVFHYKPSILGYPFFGNTHVLLQNFLSFFLFHGDSISGSKDMVKAEDIFESGLWTRKKMVAALEMHPWSQW